MKNHLRSCLLALVMCANSALAATIPVPLTQTVVGGISQYSASFGNTIMTAGMFTDTFQFTPSVPISTATAFLHSFTFIPTGAAISLITFTSATLSDGLNSYTLLNSSNTSALSGGTIYSHFAQTANNLVAGPLSLTVNGTAGANTSYAGTISISAVPEPGEWAMMIAGLGVVGLMVRRRRAN